MSKNTKLIIGVIIVVVVIGIAYFVAKNPSQPTSTEPIKIGLLIPLTGNAADIGKSNKTAFEIAAGEINEKGGVKGRKIEIIEEDSRGCDAATAATAMQKLVNIDKVVAVYSLCSNVAIASHPVAETGKVVHFGCASAPTIRDLGDYMFRIVPSDEFAGKVAAEYAKDRLGANKVAVLYCDSDWCVGIKNAFVEEYKRLGGQVLIEEQIKMGATDARTELTKIKSKTPDLVYFPGYPQESIVAFKQAKELGLNVPFLGGDAWLDTSIPQKAGNTAENKFFTTPAKNYSKSFEEKVRSDIAICTAEAYDIVYILANTMSKVGFNPEAIKNELYNLRNYKGESGIIGLDERGELIGASYDIKTFKDGKIADYELGIKSK